MLFRLTVLASEKWFRFRIFHAISFPFSILLCSFNSFISKFHRDFSLHAFASLHVAFSLAFRARKYYVLTTIVPYYRKKILERTSSYPNYFCSFGDYATKICEAVLKYSNRAREYLLGNYRELLHPRHLCKAGPRRLHHRLSQEREDHGQEE